MSMQFPALPETQGDSHLFVTLSGGCLSCILVEMDYESAHSTVESTVITLPKGFSISEFGEVLGPSLLNWAEEIGWDLVDCQNDYCFLSLCEGQCVGGTTLVVTPEYSEKPFRSVVLGTDAIVYKDQSYVDITAKIRESLSASEMIYVVLNWDEIKVFFLTQGRAGFSSEGKIVVREMNVPGSLLEKLSETTLSSLLSVNMRKDALLDLIANIRDRRITSSGSSEVHDVLRSYVTAALFNMKEKGLQSFGMNSDESVLVITGDLARVFPGRHAMLSVVDGLQLRGRYTVMVDRNNFSIPGGISFLNNRFPLPLSVIFPERHLYISTEKGGSGKVGRTAFSGRIQELGTEDEIGNDGEVIIGQTGQIYSFPLDGNGHILLEPAKDVFFPNTKKIKVGGSTYVASEYTKDMKSVIVDCRKIPVVYGPDVHGNHMRVPGWLRGLPNI